jgi:Putative beta-barrel porin 2
MFEQPPDAAIAPPLQLRYAPQPEQPLPLTVRLFLTVDEEFTDNADQTKNNRRSEFRTRIVPGISVRADRPSATFSLSYAPEVVIPHSTSGDTELNQNLSARALLWPTGRFQLSISDDFTDSNDFRDVRDPGSRQTGTGNFITNTATIEAAYVLARLRTALGYTNIINQEDQGTITDTRITHIVRPNALYTDPRFSLGGGFEVTRGDENSSLSVPYWDYKGDGRFLYVVTPTISAGVTGFYQFHEPDVGRDSTLGRSRAIGTVAIGPDGNLQAEAGADVFAHQADDTKVRPSFLAAYTHRFVPFTVSARYEQGYKSDFEELDSGGVTFTRSAGIFLTSSYFRDLTGTFGIRYEENEFEQTTLFGAPAGTTDRTWSFDLELRYMIVRSLFLITGYTGTIRNSTQESAEFYENRVHLGVTYQYDLF